MKKSFCEVLEVKLDWIGCKEIEGEEVEIVYVINNLEKWFWMKLMKWVGKYREICIKEWFCKDRWFYGVYVIFFYWNEFWIFVMV